MDQAASAHLRSQPPPAGGQGLRASRSGSGGAGDPPRRARAPARRGWLAAAAGSIASPTASFGERRRPAAALPARRDGPPLGPPGGRRGLVQALQTDKSPFDVADSLDRTSQMGDLPAREDLA